MRFDETLSLLDEWRGRHVSAAVRITRTEGPQPVAVFRGRLGSAERDRGQPGAEVFFPVRVGDGLDGPPGLQLRQAEFEEGLSERDRLYLTLEDAVVELTPA
jgi:hypothetical protein